MGQTLSTDLRMRVIAAVDGGLSRRAAAERFGIGVATAIRWVRTFRTTGEIGARAKGGDLSSLVSRRIATRSSPPLPSRSTSPSWSWSICWAASMACTSHAAQSALPQPSRAQLQKKTAHASEQDRPDVFARRQAWFDEQPELDPARRVFIDETGATTKMARLRGRARRGQRCRSPVPHGHWKTTTFTGALRLSGMTAPMVLDGPMNADAFRAYVRHVLAPTLRRGDVAVMDNLPAHKPADIRTMIEATGAKLLYLPPYSPDFNPIENAFAKLKAILRKVAPRSITDLWNAIGTAIDQFTPAECANYFTAAGYEPE